ncbi:ABC transporter ATP-binding protein [Nakamurella endophytica]|uniref:Daunorubicin resistance protein DrrA family ABC transporter ATP-binding protein n=1 Tax=Nakamurella endophytica TaxID=1748367 RepID=A0A917TA51_9ACTN|nr:ATP-binding cassette domain-containing protein [Nakamurella endophytica]GGM14813.1 daunorubicin resistance protein DrrA family ABC transporter ATP-binding protein [Nakamurella endophytica]
MSVPSSTASRPAVEIRGLVKSFGTQPVLAGVDLAVAPGEVVALLGRNGAGKTTLLSILATLLQPDAGTATVCGHDVVTDPVAVRRSLSLTGQFAAVDEVLTGEENLRMLAELAGWSTRDARRVAAAALDRFGLADAGRRRAGTYSGGLRRRLDLALGLVSQPTVLVLDEPTTGLDPASRRDVHEQVEQLAAAGTTVLLTTQYLEEADRLADRVAVLEDGRIVAEGAPAQLKSRVGTEVVELRDAAGRVVAERPSDGTAGDVRRILTDCLGGTGAVGGPDREAAYRVDIRRPSLDDVLFALTGDRSADPAPARAGHPAPVA